MILFKFLKGQDYSPTMIENALRKGELAEVRMDKDYVYIFTDEKGLEKEVSLLRINVNKHVKNMLAEHKCLQRVTHDIEQAHNRIVKVAYDKFRKYGLELVDFVIVEG